MDDSLFLNHITLLINNREYIMSDSQRYMTPVRLSSVTGAMNTSFSNMPIGAWLEFWDNHPELLDTCRCGGKAAVVSFGGSIMSGKHHRNSVCLICGKTRWRSNGSLRSYAAPFDTLSRKYKALPPCSTKTLSELIAELLAREKN